MKPRIDPATAVRFTSRARPAFEAEAVLAGASVKPMPKEARLALVVTDDVWVRRRISRDWAASYRLVIQDGRLVVGELRIQPVALEADGEWRQGPGEWRPGELLGLTAPAPDGGLSARTLQAVRLGPDITSGRRVLSEILQADRPVVKRLIRELGERGVQTLKPKSRAGRPALPDSHYRRVARAYAAAIARGSRRPVADAAAQLNLSVVEARRAVHVARTRLGLLDKTTRGRSGGTLATLKGTLP